MQTSVAPKPIGLSTPYHLARAWFRHGWIQLIEQIMAERLTAKTMRMVPAICWTCCWQLVIRKARTGFSPRAVMQKG